MTPNATYIARRSFRTINAEDGEAEFEAGVLHRASSFDTLINADTQEVVKLPLHVARNPAPYFHRVGDMGHPSIGPRMTHEEYVRELVRGNEGLTSECYWQLGCLEGWLPCEKAPENNSFTATLSKLGFEMRRPDGTVVKGMKHGAKNCTYHVKRAAGKNRDGLFAA